MGASQSIYVIHCERECIVAFVLINHKMYTQSDRIDANEAHVLDFNLQTCKVLLLFGDDSISINEPNEKSNALLSMQVNCHRSSSVAARKCAHISFGKQHNWKDKFLSFQSFFPPFAQAKHMQCIDNASLIEVLSEQETKERSVNDEVEDKEEEEERHDKEEERKKSK